MPDLLLDRLALHAKNTPDKQAVAYLDGKGNETKTFTYAQLDKETTRLAQFLLHQKKIKQGDCVILVYPPSLDFMLAFLACCKANLVAVPVFPPNPLRRDTLKMFCSIVEKCQAKVALTNKEYNHAQQLGKIQNVFKKSDAWPAQLDWIITSSSSKEYNEALRKGPLSSTDDICFLQFTSGSTSTPKGVCITHANLAHNLTCITNELQAKQDTIVVSWLPQYHDMGLIGSYLGALYCGGTGYYLSPLTFLQRPVLWLECVSRYHATHLQAPNFAFKLTARKYKEENSSNNTSLDLSSVRHIINAAEPVDADSIDSFYKTFGKFGLQKVIYPTYGLAEHTVFVCSGGKQRLYVDKQLLEVEQKVKIIKDDSIASADQSTTQLIGCGYPEKQKINVQIVNESIAFGEDLVGEIWISSPSKAKGYYLQPEETKHDFHARLEADDDDDDDEYLRTGDLGFMHKGELFICGRLKDLIIIGGRNYYPQDIEATAEAATDKVRLGCSAAFTVDPTTKGGEEVALVMELKEVPASKSEVKQTCQALANEIKTAITTEHSLNIASLWFLQPRSVPKTSSGKIARAWCRKGYLNNTLKVVYQKNFKETTIQPLEIQAANSNGNGSTNTSPVAPSGPRPTPSAIRAMGKKEIMALLVRDIANVGAIPADSLDKKTPLVSMLDSLTISQFKGMLENQYGVKTLSDEYLFRESTTITKLVEVVKIGNAPDDGTGGSGDAAGASVGQAKGLAGAMGCPPGVVCVIL